MAYHAAGAGDSDWRLCGSDHADKNSFLDEVRKQYVVTARAKGVSEKNILWKHVFRNAMLLVIAGFRRRLSACFLPARC